MLHSGVTQPMPALPPQHAAYYQQQQFHQMQQMQQQQQQQMMWQQQQQQQQWQMQHHPPQNAVPHAPYTDAAYYPPQAVPGPYYSPAYAPYGQQPQYQSGYAYTGR